LLIAPIRIACHAVVVALLVAFGPPVSGKADQIDDYVAAQMQRLHIPGVSLAIVRDGHTVKAHGYGFANLELKAPATKDTVHEIGSGVALQGKPGRKLVLVFCQNDQRRQDRTDLLVVDAVVLASSRDSLKEDTSPSAWFGISLNSLRFR
jgi:hypothetical protein